MVVEVVKGGILIPQRCVMELQGKYSVFVVNGEDQVEFRSVEVASSYETSYLIVSSGLSPGERVVYEGLQKVKSGTKVNPVQAEPAVSSTQDQDNG